ncbi:MAG TPA: HEAT repeat domain-containing protein, partial [Gemmataceae bacterium]|nr:HEAT repeat domain-containing protein [Gemmataceae bacterium]
MTVVKANLGDLTSRLDNLAKASNNLRLIEWLAQIVRKNFGPQSPHADHAQMLLGQLRDAENFLLTGGPWVQQLPQIRDKEQQDIQLTLKSQLSTTLRTIAQQHWQEQMFFQMREVAEQNAALGKENAVYLHELSRQSEAELKARLADPQPGVRWAAAQIIGARRLHLEKDLIERLDDPDPAVRQAARAALVRLARGTDFGPSPLAVKSARARAQRQWEEWLTHEEKGAAGAADLAVAADADDGLGDEERRLRDQLLQAPEAKWQETLSQLRDGKGPSNTL